MAPLRVLEKPLGLGSLLLTHLTTCFSFPLLLVLQSGSPEAPSEPSSPEILSDHPFPLLLLLGVPAADGSCHITVPLGESDPSR